MKGMRIIHSLFAPILLFISLACSLKLPNSSMHIQHKNSADHEFYALEDTSVVSQSKSIQGMNQCKDLCLRMGQKYPFKFKYHRYIRRQASGLSKYFEGNCLFAIPNKLQQWYTWSKMKIFVVDTMLFPDMKELMDWQDYQRKCEDTSLKLDEKTVDALGYKLVHSNFEYYDDGTFKNLEPFNDLNDMLKDLGGLGGLVS